MTKKKTRAQLEAENRQWRNESFAKACATILSEFIKWAGLVLIFFFIYKSISVLSGQKTTADIGINFITDIKISTFLAWTTSGAGIWYGRKQRNLRKQTTERLAGRIKDLEMQIDARRSTSGLTSRGDTNPEDL